MNIVERYLPSVIDLIVREVPKEPSNENLLSSLDNIKTSALYAAPELMSIHWGELSEVLGQELGDPTGTPWKEEISRIVRNQK